MQEKVSNIIEHNVQNPSDQDSSLEARTTTRRTSPHPTYGDKLRLDFQPKYGAVERLYKTVDFLEETNLSSRLEECRSFAEFKRHEDTGEVRVSSHHCNLRWCPMDGASRQAWNATETRRWFIGVHNPRLVTLTMKHNDLPLKEQIDILYHNFEKFRRRKFFKDRCLGGVWFFHIKKSKNDHRWHPHIHMLIDSDFLEQKVISKLWHKITGDSKIVHIKAVTNPTNSVQHAARYCAEPCDLSGLSDIDALEVYYALKDRRICGSWGTARKISFRPKSPEDSKKWKWVGDYDHVHKLKDSHDMAGAIWKAYHLKKPLAAGVDMITCLSREYDKHIRGSPKSDPQGRFKFVA
ncbi:hypothetical protein ES703_30889 [subsurface metagenome]